MKRRLMWFGAILALVIFGGLALWLTFGKSEIRLQEETVRQMVAMQLPKESKGVTVHKGDVAFKDNALVVALAMSGEKLGQTFELEATAVGVPRYEPIRGEFFFIPTDVEVTAFTLNEGKSISERLQGAVERYLPKWEGGQNFASDVGTKLDEWVTKAAEEGAELALKRMPVYRLQDDVKGLAAKVFLDKVVVENNELVITFTLWRLTWWVLMYGAALTLTVGFMITLARNPTWGTAALVGISLGGE